MASSSLRRQPPRRAGIAAFRPVETRKAFEAVVGQLTDLVHAGLLREGDVLPGERVLADAMAVSRPTVRLALAALADAGVVRVSAGRGGGARIVSTLIPDELSGTTARRLDADGIMLALEARRALEPRVVQLAALRASAEDLAELERAIEEQRAAAAAGDWKRAAAADLRFHRRIWHASGNPVLERMLVELFAELATALDMSMRTAQDTARAIALHEATLAALRSGRAARVEGVMDEHLAYLEDIAEDVFGRTPVRELPAFLRRRAEGEDRARSQRRAGRRTSAA